MKTLYRSRSGNGVLKFKLSEERPSRSLKDKGSQAGAWEPANQPNRQKMAKNTSKTSLAASVAAMAMKNNGREGADDGKQPFENRESQKAISIRNH